MERVVDEYDLLQHVKVPTHKVDGILDVIMTSPGNPSVADVDVEDMGFPDHFLVTATLSTAKPRSECTSFEARNIKGMDFNVFRSKLLASSAYTAPKTKTDDNTDQLRECVVGILDSSHPRRR